MEKMKVLKEWIQGTKEGLDLETVLAFLSADIRQQLTNSRQFTRFSHAVEAYLNHPVRQVLGDGWEMLGFTHPTDSIIYPFCWVHQKEQQLVFATMSPFKSAPQNEGFLIHLIHKDTLLPARKAIQTEGLSCELLNDQVPVAYLDLPTEDEDWTLWASQGVLRDFYTQMIAWVKAKTTEAFITKHGLALARPFDLDYFKEKICQFGYLGGATPDIISLSPMLTSYTLEGCELSPVFNFLPTGVNLLTYLINPSAVQADYLRQFESCAGAFADELLMDLAMVEAFEAHYANWVSEWEVSYELQMKQFIQQIFAQDILTEGNAYVKTLDAQSKVVSLYGWDVEFDHLYVSGSCDEIAWHQVDRLEQDGTILFDKTTFLAERPHVVAS